MDTKFRGQQKPTRRLTDCHKMFQEEEAPRRMFLCRPPFPAGRGGHFSTARNGPRRFIVTFQSPGCSLWILSRLADLGLGSSLMNSTFGSCSRTDSVAS